MKKVVSIDIARAIGIILVVTGHYFPDGSPNWYVCMREWIYSFHMPLFMFISGYVYELTKREETYLNFLGRKAKRLLIPYLIVSTIIISIKLISQTLMGMDLKNAVGVDAFLKMLYEPEAAIHLWFIFALWWIFVIVPLFRWKGGNIVLLIIGIVAHYLPKLFISFDYPTIFCLDKAAEYLLYFMLGVVLYDAGLDLNRPHKLTASLILLLFASNSIFNFAPSAAPFIGIAGIMALSSLVQTMPEHVIRPFVTISKSSYTIYLIHSIFIGFIVTAFKFVPSLLDTSGHLFGLGALLIVSITVMLPTLQSSSVFRRIIWRFGNILTNVSQNLRR